MVRIPSLVPMPFLQRHSKDDWTGGNTSTTACNEDDFDRQAAYLIPAEIRMISGCHSEQTSADVAHVGRVAELPNPVGMAGGACTSALLEILYKRVDEKRQSQYQKDAPTQQGTVSSSSSASLSFQQVLLDLRSTLQTRGFDQIPQLTSSRPLELQETPFSFVNNIDKNTTGTCRAVLVGINYRGQSGQLSGCINDVLNVKKYLMTQTNNAYKEDNIFVLVDDGKHHSPTRANIIIALEQLVAQSVAGDSVYFHYSGHGGLLYPEWNMFKNKKASRLSSVSKGNDSSSTTTKHYDETLYPLDHQRSGHIRDFSLYSHFVKPMAAGVMVTCVMDCCHSGAVLDLPYQFQPTPSGSIRQIQSSRHMDGLTNLAFLYLLMGGSLPLGFENVTEYIEDVTGGSVAEFQGMGVEDDGEHTNEGDYAGEDGVDNATEDPTIGERMGDEYTDSNGASDMLTPDAYGDTCGDYGGSDTVHQGYGNQDEFTHGDYTGADYTDGAGNFGTEWDGGDMGTADPDVDCGCFVDLIGSMLEEL